MSMHAQKILRLSFGAAVSFLLFACNLPSSTSTAEAIDTPSIPVEILLTETPTPPVTIYPTDTSTPLPAPTAQDPLVAFAALCWWGPGPVYEVISSLKQDIRVKLTGKGSIPGWYLVENPIYHVPCWVQDDYLQIDPNTDLAALPIFTPPPTPTPSPTQTRTPTATLTPIP